MLLSKSKNLLKLDIINFTKHPSRENRKLCNLKQTIQNFQINTIIQKTKINSHGKKHKC